MNITEKAVKHLETSDRVVGCGFGDKNGFDKNIWLINNKLKQGLTLVIRGKMCSGDVATGINALQRTLDYQSDDEIKRVTINRYKWVYFIFK